MSVALDDVPETARRAWTRLRDELVALLGDDLVAIWAYGGTTAPPISPRLGDLDTCVVVRRPIDPRTLQALETIQAAIASELGVEWDTWYLLEADARARELPRDHFRPDRQDATWAINRGHWLGGAYVHLFGAEPAEIVAPPEWRESLVALTREMEHLESHAAAGDTDPYEATYAFLNGSRILRALSTRDVAISKRAAGPWALEHLPVRWHPVLLAAGRAYDGEATSEDTELLAAEMAPFVAMVRDRLAGVLGRAG